MKPILTPSPTAGATALTLCTLLLLAPQLARAETRQGAFEFSPFIGYNLFQDRQNLKDRLIYGGRLGYNLTEHFALEGAMEFVNTRVDDTSLTGNREGQFRSPIERVDLSFYHVDAVYHFAPQERFNPFVALGYGGAKYSPDIATKDMGLFSAGVGAKYWMAQNVALRFDLRDHMVTESFQETYHNFSASIGLVFAFGGQRQAAAAPVEKVVVLASEPKVEEKVRVLAAQPKVVILAFEDVHFDHNQSTLNPEAKRILRRSVQVLKDNPKAKIRIAGYTSASGTEEYNQGLSERRARAVENFLVEEGVVSPGRLSTIGYGQNRPAEYEAAPQDLYSPAAKANMRVLFEIIVK